MEHSTLTLEAPNRVQEGDQLSRAVVEAVSNAEGVDATELTPLYTAIDPDALESLFKPEVLGEDQQVDGEIRFSYHGYEVRVTASGEVDLTDTPNR